MPGLHSSGVPQWIVSLSRQLGDGHLSLENSSSERIIALAQGVVADWISSGRPCSRPLNLFEMFCGQGGICQAVRDRGGMARGFDRTSSRQGRAKLPNARAI
eukprot:9240432-Pyramimonas_sp.AAC.1